MGKLTKTVFDPSCCEGSTGPNDNSASPCGCDKGANWICEYHRYNKVVKEKIGVKMPRVYIAAPWACKKEAAQARDKFVAAGIPVTSRWIDLDVNDKDASIFEQEALNDIDDMEISDGMVVLQLAKSEGKAFEQGFFLGGMIGGSRKIILVSPHGDRGNVFQHLAYAYHMVPDIDSAIEEVKKWQIS